MTVCEIKLSEDICMISGVLDFNTVPEIFDEIRSILLGKQALVFDLKGVSSSNSAGLALLIEMRAIAAAQGLPIRISHVPHQILRLAQVSKLESFFNA